MARFFDYWSVLIHIHHSTTQSQTPVSFTVEECLLVTPICRFSVWLFSLPSAVAVEAMTERWLDTLTMMMTRTWSMTVILHILPRFALSLRFPSFSASFFTSQDNSLFINRSRSRANRLNESEVEAARQKRVKKMKMQSIIREVLCYCCFLWIVFTITFSNHNPNAFLQVNHLRHHLLNLGHSQHDYTQVIPTLLLFPCDEEILSLVDDHHPRLLVMVGEQLRQESSCTTMVQWR